MSKGERTPHEITMNLRNYPEAIGYYPYQIN
jgi:hypothetical protein